MSEMSEEAEAAGIAAAVAVENAKEQQETREMAANAEITAGTAEIESEIAAEDSQQALEIAANAEGTAIVAGAIASDAAAQSQEAQNTADEARSEIQIFREEIGSRFDRIESLLAPKEPAAESGIQEVTTDDNAGGESGTNRVGHSDSGTDKAEDKGNQTGSSSQRTTGFNKSRRARK